jgi:hypothetical protein
MATESQIDANRENAKLSTALWSTLAPDDPVEEVTAARSQAAKNKTRNTDHHAAVPMIYPAYLPTQNAIDLARTSVQSGIRRAKADLDKMQAARKKRNYLPPFCKSNPNPPRPHPQSPNPGSPPQQFKPNPTRFPRSLM